jgi:hypothetical protein
VLKNREPENSHHLKKLKARKFPPPRSWQRVSNTRFIKDNKKIKVDRTEKIHIEGNGQYQNQKVYA